MLRRALLLTLPAMLLAACTVTKNGSATTVTIDTHKVDTDGTAILQALNSILAAPSIAVLLGPIVPALIVLNPGARKGPICACECWV